MLRLLADQRYWLRGLAYALVFLSAFSIAGVTTVTITLFVAVAYHVWRERPRLELPGWLIAAMLALPAAAVVSALANPQPIGNLFDLRREYQIFLPLALIPALQQTRTRNLLLMLAVPLGILAVYAVIQHEWGVNWARSGSGTTVRAYGHDSYYARGTFSHHLTFSGYMLLNALLFAGLAFKLPGRLRWVWALGSAAAAISLIAALGRSGWIGLAVGGLMLLAGFPRRILLPVGLAGVMFVAAVGLLITGNLRNAVPIDTGSTVLNRALSTSLTHDRERLYLWESALLGIQDHPVFGVGYGNDKKMMGTYRREVSKRHGYKFSVKPSMHSHNIYLQVTFELGLLGLAAYLYMWFGVFRWNAMWVRRAGDRCPFETALLTGASCAMAGSLVAGLFESNFFDAEVRTMILIVMGLSLTTGIAIRRILAGEAQPDPR